MEIIGFEKNSLLDYPKNIASVIFTPGCNMNCWYCHNREILNETKGSYNPEKVMDFIIERKDFLDGVVITGGEPTLQPDLIDFMQKLKEIPTKIKLDTNGTNPEIIREILDKNLVDFIAMDLKAPFEKYNIITPIKDIEKIKESVEMIKNSGVEYEFRTTFAPNLTKEDIVELVKSVAPIDRYALQLYKTPPFIAEDKSKNHEKSEFEFAKENTIGFVKEFIIRGF